MTPVIRRARPGDAAQLIELMALLGHKVDEAGTRDRIARLEEAAIPQLVAADGDRVVGLCGLHQMTAVHRDEPVGRITILVVMDEFRGRGIGRALIEAAERHFREAGCRLVEVSSNDGLVDAHRFYEHAGYVRTSKRFAKRFV